MVLEPNQILELIREPRSKEKIREAVYQEERLKMHGEPKVTRYSTLGAYSGNSAESDFFSYVDHLLPKRKYERFVQLYTYPVKTNEFFENVYSEFHKVFQSNNSYVKCEFSDEELEMEFKDKEAIISDWFRVQGFRNMATRINGLLVVDMPEEEDGDPYFYFVDVKSLVDIKNDENGNAHYVILKVDEDIYNVFDKQYSRTVEVTGDSIRVLKEFEHGLGWCPARMMWTDDLSHRDHIVKQSPFSKSLSRLDLLLFKMVSSEYADLYSSYPILSAYKAKCDYSDHYGNQCNHGSIYLASHDDPRMQGETIDCPACKGSDMIGAGTIFWIDPPEDKEQHDAIETIKRLDADVESLEYIKGDIGALENQIRFDVNGRGEMEGNSQAKNEMQIAKDFEAMQNAMMRYKRNMEIAQQFITDTFATMKYGDAYGGCIINYGDQFYLSTEEQLKADIKMSKDAGLPSYEIVNMLEQLNGTKYRNSPTQKKRSSILMDLDPFPAMSLNEILKMESGLDPMDVIIKKNFDQFVNRFERENINLVRFGQDIDYNVKIDSILEVFREYANEKAGSLNPDDDEASQVTSV